MPAIHVPDRAVYDAARLSVAILERPDTGCLVMSGRDRVTHLHRLCTNEVRHLRTGQGLTAVLTTDKGRIKDMVTVLAREEDLLLLTSAGHGAVVKAWIERFVIREKVTIADATADVTELRLLGPHAPRALREATGLDVADLTPWHWVGGEGITAFRGELLLGERAVHVLSPAATASALRTRLVELGALPADEGTFQVIRILSGVPEAPGELNEDRNPWEARLGGSIDLDKGCYIGQEVVARLDTYKKVQRSLVRVEIDAVDVPAGDRLALEKDGRMAGTISSLARHPEGQGLVGLGYLAEDLAVEGTSLLAGGAPARVLPAAADPPRA
jgi:folate-binding protein YgfZ